jgi:DNA-binding MarR family transcriptional regulator
VSRGLLRRGGDPNDRRRTPLQLTELGERVRARALAESGAMELELRQRFGDSMIERFRTVLTEFVESHGAGAELAASRSRASSVTS